MSLRLNDGSGLRKALVRVGTIVVFAIGPVVVLATMLHVGRSSESLAVDFHFELYPEAKALLHGHNPFPGADFVPGVGGNLLWPPVAAAVVAPFTLLPLGVAEIVMGVLGLGCFAAALYVVRVRDWRVYGMCCLWPQVAGEMRVSHLTPLLALLAAFAWRARGRTTTPGWPVGLAIGLKFLVWPLALWLVALRRTRAAALAAVIAASSLLLVLPFTRIDDYVTALPALGRHFDQDSYTVFGLLVQLGVGETVARLVTLLTGLGLVVAMWRYRSFTLALAASLTLTPIVWLDYFSLAAVPLAIVRPVLSPIWLLPLLTWGAPGTGLGIGDPLQILRVLGVFAIVLGVAAPRSMTLTAPPLRRRAPRRRTPWTEAFRRSPSD